MGGEKPPLSYAEKSLLWLNTLIRDLQYGFRMMRKARLVSIAVAPQGSNRLLRSGRNSRNVFGSSAI